MKNFIRTLSLLRFGFSEGMKMANKSREDIAFGVERFMMETKGEWKDFMEDYLIACYEEIGFGFNWAN